ncbi:MAG: endolytic transglycosylase MltG [Hydrogenophaga sp.]|nr:endolytic transglycosylase MltG [Hydrogenophaga sp.]
MMPVKRVLMGLLTLSLLAVLALAGSVWLWLERPLGMPATVTAQQPMDLVIAPGTSARALAKQLTRAGIDAPDWALFAYFRLSGDSRRIQAGSYEFTPGLTPKDLLDKLVRGDQAFRQITLIEGWNYRQVFQAIESVREVQQDTASMDVPDIMTAIGKPGVHPEGQFFPAIYRFPKNAKASTILRMASVALDRKLAQAWAERDDGLPLKSPREALILASIIEKETGAPQDRADIGGVFINRMRIGMRLQTDPTVIYGLGERFDGNLRKVDLQTDTVYNTYTRAGLPPTPIAIPSYASMLAAVQPSDTKAFYFVARGDGTSQFSVTLAEHNAAVRRYILGR